MPEFVPNYIRNPAFPYVGNEAITKHKEVVDNNIDEKVTRFENDHPAASIPIPSLDSTATAHARQHGHHAPPHHPQPPSQQQYCPQQQQQPPHYIPQQHYLPPHLHHPTCQAFAPYPGYHPRIFVLKVRVADQLDPDFIEVEFPRLECDVMVAVDEDVHADEAHQQSAAKYGDSSGRGGVRQSSQEADGGGVAASSSAPPSRRKLDSNGSMSMTELLTFESFVDILCDELRIPTPNLILKIRKLPDTIVRKSRDVHRLKDFQVSMFSISLFVL